MARTRGHRVFHDFAWPGVLHARRQLPSKDLTIVAGKAPAKKLPCPVAPAWPDPKIVQRVLHQLPWGVNVELLDAVKEPKVRLWCAERTASEVA